MHPNQLRQQNLIKAKLDKLIMQNVKASCKWIIFRITKISSQSKRKNRSLLQQLSKVKKYDKSW